MKLLSLCVAIAMLAAFFAPSVGAGDMVGFMSTTSADTTISFAAANSRGYVTGVYIANPDAACVIRLNGTSTNSTVVVPMAGNTYAFFNVDCVSVDIDKTTTQDVGAYAAK